MNPDSILNSRRSLNFYLSSILRKLLLLLAHICLRAAPNLDPPQDNRSDPAADQRSLLRKSKVWADAKLLVRQNNRAFSEVRFTSEFETDLATQVLDEAAIRHQSNLEDPLIFSSVIDGLLRSFATFAAQWQQTEMDAENLITMPAGLTPQPKVLRLTNRSGRVLEHVILGTNGKRSDTLAHLASRLSCKSEDNRDLSELDRVLILQQNLRRLVTNKVRYVHPKTDPLSDDPVAFFNFFGEALCGGVARIFSVLCHNMSIPARVWRTNTHTVPEVFLDGRWRIVEVHAQSPFYYPDPNDSGALLGIEDLVGGDHQQIARNRFGVSTNQDGHTDEVRRTRRAISLTDRSQMKLLLTPEQVKEIAESVTPVDVRMTLMPGETVAWAYDCRGPWYSVTSMSFLKPARPVALLREFDILDSPSLHPWRHEGLARVDNAQGVRLKAEKTATLWIAPDRSHPVLDVALDIGLSAGNAESILCQLFSDDRLVGDVMPLFEEDPTRLHFRLRRALLRRHHGERIEIRLSLAQGMEIAKLRVLSMHQIAAPAMPQFSAGRNSVDIFLDDVPHGASEVGLAVTLDSSEGTPWLDSPGFSAVQPAVGARTSGADLSGLRWSCTAVTGSNEPREVDMGRDQCRYEVVVSHDPRFIFLVGSNFHRVATESRLVFDDRDRDFLAAGRQYYWRVRMVTEELEPISPWSNTFDFSTN